MLPKKGKTPALHVKCDPIAVGTVITDTKKTEITVQKEFAQGGFGRICDAKVKGSTAKYIIKFEPTDNGPLFNENHLYPRILTQAALQKYTSEHKLKFLGLPYCVSSGVYKDVRYLVMPKYDYTLEQLISEKKGVLPLANTVSVVLSVLDSLEYIHSCDYAHGDIKAGNLMLMSKTDFSRVYLIDFGLAKKINKPVEKDDPKKAHNGTALFNSMDAHRGCGPSFRGDIEILAHNVLLWLAGKLPWKAVEDNPNAVQSQKADLLSDIPKKVKALVPDSKAAALLITLYEAAKKLKIEQKPNYAAIKKAIGSAEGASKRKRGAVESDEEVEKPTPRSRARKQDSEDEQEEEPKPSRSRGRPKKEPEAPTEPEETEPEEAKPRSRPRKAGAAIAAAKKSKIIYPGLSKKPSVDQSDDDDGESDDEPAPSKKPSKPPTAKSSTARSRRPAPPDSPPASSSAGSDLDTVSAASDIENMARTAADDKPTTAPVRERLGRRAKDNAVPILENSIIVGKKVAKETRAQKTGTTKEGEGDAPKVPAKRGRPKKTEEAEAGTDEEAETKPSSSKAPVKKTAAKKVAAAKPKAPKKEAVAASAPSDEDADEAGTETDDVPPAKKQKKEERSSDAAGDANEDSAQDEEPEAAPAPKQRKTAPKAITKVVAAKKAPRGKKAAAKNDEEIETLAENADEEAQPEGVEDEKPAPSKPPAKRGRKPKVTAAQVPDEEEEVSKPAPSKTRGKPAKVLKSPEPVVGTDEAPDLPLRAEGEEAMEVDEEVPEEQPEKPTKGKTAKKPAKGKATAEAASQPESPSKPVGIIPGVTENMKSPKAKEALAAKKAAEAAKEDAPGPSKNAGPRAKRATKKDITANTSDVEQQHDDVAPRTKRGAAKKLPAVEIGQQEQVVAEQPNATEHPESPSKPVGIIPGVTKNMKSAKAKEAIAAKEAAEAAKEAGPSKTGGARPKRGPKKDDAADVEQHEDAPKAPNARPKRGAKKNYADEEHADYEAANNAEEVIPATDDDFEEPAPSKPPPKKAAPKKPAAKPARAVPEEVAPPAGPVDSDIVVAPRGNKKSKKIKDDSDASAPSSPANPIIPGLTKNLKSDKAKAALAIKEAAAAAASSSKPSASVATAYEPDAEVPMEVDEPEPAAPSRSRKRVSDVATTSKPAKAPRTESPLRESEPSLPSDQSTENTNFSSSVPVRAKKAANANDSFSSEKGGTSANAIIPGVTKNMKSAKAQEAYALKTAADKKQESPKPSSSTTDDRDRRTPSFIVPPVETRRPRRGNK